MAGILPKKVHLYDNDGAYIQSFQSISEFARECGEEENIFSRSKKETIQLDNGNIICLKRIGKEKIRQWKVYQKSHYTRQYAGRNIAESKMDANTGKKNQSYKS